MMNAANLYLRIGRRASWAASGLPPIALSRKPKSERLEEEPDDERHADHPQRLHRDPEWQVLVGQAEEPVDLLLGHDLARRAGRPG